MKRQYYLDYAKCSAILFMITIHVLWEFGCDFEAPLGYILNVLRELPLAVYGFMKEGMTFSSHELWFEFLQGDILQFAGLAMILFGVLRLIHLSDKVILLIGCVMSLTGYLIPIISTDSIAINATAGLFVYINHPEETMMCFPLLTWFIYPAFGYWLAKKLKQMEDSGVFFRKALLPCFLFALIGSVLEMKLHIYMMRNNAEFYHMVSHDALISLSYTVFCFAAFFFICRNLPDKINRFFSSISGALNLIYLIHWPLIYIAVLILFKISHKEFSYIWGFATIIIITVISVFFGVRLKKTVKKQIANNPNSILRILR